MASASDVLPEPLCPIRATLRMSAGAIAVMAKLYQRRRGERSPAYPPRAQFAWAPPPRSAGRGLRYRDAPRWRYPARPGRSMKTLRTAVSMILSFLLPYLVQRWDRRGLGPEQRAAAWNGASWGSALYGFGPLSMIGWAWVTRQGVRRWRRPG